MMENIPSGHADVFLSYSHDDRETENTPEACESIASGAFC